MNRKWILALMVACPVMALAQTGPARSASSGNAQPYQPAVPAPTANVYGGGGWGGNSGASTAAGSALGGMSQVISAAGQYNLSTSAAAVNMTQAEHNQIQNDMLATDTYFQMRATNRAARETEREPKPTMEQLVRISREGVPKPLNTSQVDPVTGRVAWPGTLQDASFDAQRAEVDQLFAQWATHGGLPYSEQSKVRQAVDTMLAGLKAQIRQIPPQTYVACRGFLQSLCYAASKTYMQ
jgi:hypothetical protein